MIKDPALYFQDGCGRCKHFATDDCNARCWGDGLAILRQACLDAGLTEEAKWGHPCYTFNGANVVILGAFKSDFHMSFFKASLMQDESGLFIKRGENTQVASVLQFTNTDQVKDQLSVIRSYLQEAIAVEKSGIKPVKPKPSFDIPEELVIAMDEGPELAEAFYALNPGRQRGYCMTIGSAKQQSTRLNRIAKYRAQILRGKGFNEA